MMEGFLKSDGRGGVISSFWYFLNASEEGEYTAPISTSFFSIIKLKQDLQLIVSNLIYLP